MSYSYSDHDLHHGDLRSIVRGGHVRPGDADVTIDQVKDGIVQRVYSCHPQCGCVTRVERPFLDGDTRVLGGCYTVSLCEQALRDKGMSPMQARDTLRECIRIGSTIRVLSNL